MEKQVLRAWYQNQIILIDVIIRYRSTHVSYRLFCHCIVTPFSYMKEFSDSDFIYFSFSHFYSAILSAISRYYKMLDLRGWRMWKLYPHLLKIRKMLQPRNTLGMSVTSSVQDLGKALFCFHMKNWLFLTQKLDFPSKKCLTYIPALGNFSSKESWMSLSCKI